MEDMYKWAKSLSGGDYKMKFVPLIDRMTKNFIYINPKIVSAIRENQSNTSHTDVFFVGEERTWLTVEDNITEVRKMLQEESE